MKNINIIALIIALLMTGINQLKGGEYSPMDVKTITLKNGLTVYLNEDHNTTSVFGAVIVNGGGKRDPQDATGIAHYLEHLLFKGTEEMGTVNFEAEKVYLDSIRMKYDVLATTQNEDKRLKIQKEINRLSLQAGEYAIPNEFDRLLEGMGGTWINAFTSDDVIAYFNKFPGDQLEKWLEIYSHRFEKPVFRLFQAELETVYEEKNRAMDNVFRNVFVTYLENFFKRHPYGQQTVLGSVEHLKNPSLTKMQEYFDTYYVANNMALIISGDFSIEETIPLIEQKFGNWRSGELPPPIDIVEGPFEGREKISKRMTPIKFGIMGFRTVPAGHPDETALNVCNQLLTNNANTGLINQLTVDGKILEAGAFTMDYADLGANNFIFVPKLFFQSLNKAEKLVLGQIEKLKAGDFDDEFFNAVKLTMIRQNEENMESMEGRLFTLIDAHVKGRSWDDIISLPEKINTITKEEVVAIANTYFGDDYLVMHSKMGFPKKHKLDKPQFEPIIPKNTEKKSAFAAKLDEVPEGEMKLKYIEFDKDVQKKHIKEKVHLYHTHNPINGIFTLNFQYGIGTKAEPKLQQTAELLNLLGTEVKDFHTFKSELQKIGTTIDFRADKNYFKIQVKGFDTHFERSLEYVSEIMTKVKG
ncbi:MAG: pitrilysin family protein, partial [Candidatus Marinimicrobia bacterium]|nr:pitrilysin family protein [Candidatus Neomarinimicrobiota bacterium]